jgi:hypothetical protein
MSVEDYMLDYIEPNSVTTRTHIPYKPLASLNDPFVLNDIATRNYKTQYANIYFTRLLKLRPLVAKVANERWAETPGKTFRAGLVRSR